MDGPCAFSHKLLPQAFIGGNTPGNDDVMDIEFIGGHQGLVNQNIHHCRLETGSQVIDLEWTALRLQRFYSSEHGGLPHR